VCGQFELSFLKAMREIIARFCFNARGVAATHFGTIFFVLSTSILKLCAHELYIVCAIGLRKSSHYLESHD